MPSFMQSWRSHLRSRQSIWFAILHFALSSLWIFITVKLVLDLTFTVADAARWAMMSALFCIGITSCLFYAIIRRLARINTDLEVTLTSRTAALSASEEQSRMREEWLRRLVANLPDVAWTTSEDMRTIFVSPNVESMFGFSVAEVCEDTESILLKRVHPEDWPRVLEAYQALFTRGQRFDEEFRAQRKDGHWIWVHNRATQTHEKDGVLFADGILSDITARKEAERAREVANQRFRLLVERNLAGMFRAEAGGKMLECNPALVRMLGYDSAAELEGRTSAEILYEPEKERVILESLTRDGAINNAEIRLRRKDGSVLWGLHNVALAPSDSRGPACIEGTVIDITQRRQSAEALQKQLSLMQAISTSAPDALLVEDAGGLLRFINPAGERMLGYTMPELLGKVMHDVCHYKRIDGSPLPRSECAMAQACASGKALHDQEDVYFRRDGTPFYVARSSAPMFEGDRLAGFVMVLQDITQRKLAERQYQSLQEQFLHAQKMEAVGRLAGGIAHDFNNLLQIINGYSDLIEGECASNPRLTKRAQAIHEAGNRAARLTKQLLDFSRKDPGAVQLIALGPAIKELMSMLRTLVGENIELTTSNTTDGTCVKISVGQLEQVIMNLAVNARDAIPKGGRLHIETTCVTLDETSRKAFGYVPPGVYVQLSVFDTGCGMDAETMKHVFEPFFTTKGRGQGTGLGLSTVYGIVTRNAGGIRIDSTLGVGSTFHICLPVAERHVSARETPEHVTPPHGTESILLAEDEEGVRALLSNQLRGLGYKVLEASNGEEALQLASDAPQSFDLLITDMLMPTMGGQDLSERIRELCPTIKTVRMSGYNDTPHPTADDVGPELRHLQKPFSLGTLAARVRRALDEQASYGESSSSKLTPLC